VGWTQEQPQEQIGIVFPSTSHIPDSWFANSPDSFPQLCLIG